MANIIAGAIIGIGLIVGGIAFTLFFTRRPDPRPLSTGDRIAKYALIGLIGAGAAWWSGVVYGMKRLASHQVIVFDEGFEYDYVGKSDICRWTEIAEIREQFTHEQLKVLKVPGATIKNIDRSFVVRRNDGNEFRFTVNSVDSIPDLANYLEAARKKYDLPWQQIELK